MQVVKTNGGRAIVWDESKCLWKLITREESLLTEEQWTSAAISDSEWCKINRQPVLPLVEENCINLDTRQYSKRTTEHLFTYATQMRLTPTFDPSVPGFFRAMCVSDDTLAEFKAVLVKCLYVEANRIVFFGAQESLKLLKIFLQIVLASRIAEGMVTVMMPPGNLNIDTLLKRDQDTAIILFTNRSLKTKVTSFCLVGVPTQSEKWIRDHADEMLTWLLQP
jgi:hypothetical protein